MYQYDLSSGCVQVLRDITQIKNIVYKNSICRCNVYIKLGLAVMGLHSPYAYRVNTVVNTPKETGIMLILI